MNFKNQAAQGDLLLTRVDEIPQGLKQKQPERGQHVLAHSETGHNHVVGSKWVNYFESANDDFVSYIEVKQKCEVIHLRGWDTHAPISLDPGKYRVTRQREYIPAGYRRAAD